MVNIFEIKDSHLTDQIEAHEKIGGALRTSVFEIKPNYLGQFPDEYNAHLTTARQTLEKQNFEWNFHFNKVATKNRRDRFAYAQTDFDKLDSSGQKIDVARFLGPHFDLHKMKPLFRGQTANDTPNAYFYYDQDELPENKIDINAINDAYRKVHQESEGNFIHALMEPPYSLSLGKDIYLRGKYILEFLDYFFSDLTQLTIYTWDTTCSVVFDAGNEWWGSYFWTIHNPAKNWYIGIIASETD